MWYNFRHGTCKDKKTRDDAEAAAGKGWLEAADEVRSTKFAGAGPAFCREKGRFAMNGINEGIREDHGCLCAILGMFFGPIGLIVAAIIGGAQGVVSALLGMILPTILGLVLFFAMGGLAFISALLA